ncbi:MAG: protein phosphatase 2C domain-containing protein [Actinomycetota bacterium]|nr:protein phosphatase 2C domain-containing protein [Actinomycetota bacterium]
MPTVSFGRPSVASEEPWRLRSDVSSSGAGIRAEAGEVEGWALRGASVTGVRHRLAGLGNDDAFAWRAGAPALTVAVADGVSNVTGSAAAAARAADVAVAAAGRAISDGARAVLDADTALVAAVAGANQALTGGEGATTLVVAVVAPDGTVTGARVGDSSAFVLVGGAWSELFAPTGGAGDEDVVSTTTSALPSPSPRMETAVAQLSAGDALVLVTDGVADPLRDGPETVAPALAGTLGEPPGVVALIGLVDFSRQGCHDDRTLLGVWRLAPAVEPPGGDG